MRRFGAPTALVVLFALGLAGVSGATISRSASSPVPALADHHHATVPVAMTIRNDGATPEVLIGAFTAAANPVEVHDTRLVEGRQVMDRVEDGITISPGATVVLESGGEHLMLVGVRGALVQGDEFPLTICFRDAGEVPIRVRVRRKVDAAGTSPLPPVTVGGVTVSFASSPPAQPPTADRRPRLFPTVESNWG